MRLLSSTVRLFYRADRICRIREMQPRSSDGTERVSRGLSRARTEITLPLLRPIINGNSISIDSISI